MICLQLHVTPLQHDSHVGGSSVCEICAVFVEGKDLILLLTSIVPDIGRSGLPYGIPEKDYHFSGAAQEFPAFNFPPQGH